MSTISTTITTGISLGSGAYPSPLTITPAGAVVYSGSSNAVYGVGTLLNLGTIAQGGADPATGDAIYLTNGGLVRNGNAGDTAALINGAGGVAFSTGAAAGTVDNDGTILGVQNPGALLGSGGTITNGAGTVTTALIQGYQSGITSTGNALVVNNFATIQASDLVRGNYAILAQGNATITNSGTAALVEGAGGISIALAGTVTNQGVIAADPGGYAAVVIGGAGYVANLGSAATIQGFGGVTIGGAGTVSNAGTIALAATSGSYFGVDLQSGTVVDTGTAALILGYSGGIAIAQDGSVGNAGTIEALATFGRPYAVAIGGVGTVVNTGTAALIEGLAGVSIGGAGSVANAGTILSTYYRGNFGVVLADGGFVTNQGTGAVIAGYGGVYAQQAATISNAGTIESNEYSALGDNFGVKLAAGGIVINSGTGSLLYGSVAVYVAGAAGTITNDGMIQSYEGLRTGIRLTDGGTVTNGSALDAGAVISATQYGVLVTSGPATVVNFGDITGGGVGLQLTGGGTIIDSGEINGSAAISFGGAGDNLLVLQPGYAINGGIVADGSDNTLELQGNIGASVTANYAGLNLSGFQTVAFAPGSGGYADLVITNNGDLPAMIAGFSGFNDNIDLTTLSDAGDDAIASFNATTHILTVTGDDSATVDLQLGPGSYSGVNFAAANDGTNGTLVFRQSGSGAQNVRPTISGLSGDLGVAAGSSTEPFTNVTIQDNSSGATDTVTVTLSNPDAGSLSNLGGGSFNTTTGVFTATGTPSQVSGDIDGLVFTPTVPASGILGIATGLTITATGPGGSASNSTTSVTAVDQIFGLGTVEPGNIVIAVSPDGSSFPNATANETNEAIVLNPSGGDSYQLPAGYQAEFLGASGDAVTLSDPSVGYALLVGNAAADTITSGAGHDTLLGGGGAPTLQFTAGASDGTASVTGGSVTLLDAGSHDTLHGGTGSTTASVTGAYGTFLGNPDGGTSSVIAGGQGDTLSGGGSHANFQLSTGVVGGVVFGGTGSLVLSDAGAQNTVLGANGTTAATLSGASSWFFGSAGSASVLASGQHDTLAGGSGSMAASLSGGNALILGQGTLSAMVSGTGDTVAAASASQATVSLGGSSGLVMGGAGLLTVSISGANDMLAAGSGTTLATVAGSSDAVLGGSGRLSVNDGGTGDTIVGFGAASVAVSVTGGDALVLGGSHMLTASLGGTGATIAGGSGGADITIANIYFTTGDLVFAGAGSLTLNDQGQRDTIAAFASNSAHASIGGAHNMVLGGATVLTASVGGAGDTIIGAGGALHVTTGSDATGTVVLGGSGSFAVDDGGSGDTIAPFAASAAAITTGGSNALVFGGSNPDSVDVTGAGSTIVAGSGALAVTAGGGSSGLLVFGSTGRLNFAGGAGGATIVSGTGGASITGGAGTITLFGSGGGSDTFAGAGGGVDFHAGAGNETLNASGSTADNAMWGGGATNSADSMVGGQGNDTLMAGAGPDTLVGSTNDSSADCFVFFAQAGGAAAQELVQNFTASDEVLLVGYGAGAAQTALGSASSSNGATTITLSDSTTITFTDIASASDLTGHVMSL